MKKRILLFSAMAPMVLVLTGCGQDPVGDTKAPAAQKPPKNVEKAMPPTDMGTGASGSGEAGMMETIPTDVQPMEVEDMKKAPNTDAVLDEVDNGMAELETME
jgi:hypothetical protein